MFFVYVLCLIDSLGINFLDIIEEENKKAPYK